MSLSQIELVWIRVRVEWECFWVNLREDNKVSEYNMAVSESKMAVFKMAAIIKLSQKEWVKFFCANGGNQCWQLWVMKGWIQDGLGQDGWTNLGKFGENVSEFDLGVRVRLVRVFLSESDNKMSESNMAVSESNMAIQDGCHHQVEWEMNEWSFFVQNGGNQCWQLWVSLKGKIKMADSNHLSQNNSRWLPSSSWVRIRMSEVFLCKWWEPILSSVSEFERKN